MTRPPILRGLLAAALLATGLALPLVTAAAAPAAAADPVAVVGHACPPGVGVTVVVDFTALLDEVHLGCAVGAQTNGMAALGNAGFAIGHDGVGAGAVRTIDGHPAEPYPCGWLTCGYWSYWTTDAQSAWTFRTTGAAGTGALPIGAVEGWSWAPGFDDSVPRVSPTQSGTYAPDCTLAPTAPVLSIIASTEVLPFSIADGGPVEVAILGPGDPLAGASYVTTSSLALSSSSGPTRVVARRAGGVCPSVPLFDATYDVRPTYPGRAGVDAGNPAVDRLSPAIVGYATGYSSYTPGANVNASFQTPANALGPIGSALVVLGDRGEITLTFDKPITNGAGYDFALYENGFASGANDFLELGYVEVSSNGTDFVRFDSASRRATPVGAFAVQPANELGGVMGRDVDGKGTPFDLTALANQPAVRSGLVDLRRITHVRVRDIVGDGLDLDSFGRPIYDPHPVTGSAGVDLKGLAVLHQLERTTVSDFDGDGRTDVAVFREGRWHIKGHPTVAFGQADDLPVPGQWDEDPETDIAVFRPSTGRWYVQGRPSVAYGQAGDIPVPGDYDGDGVIDVAVFRPSTGRWYVQGRPSVAFGQEGDVPVPGQWDEDPETDIAVFRPSTGRWYFTDGTSVGFGALGDVPVPGQWDADPLDDIAVFRPSTGRWYVHGTAESVAFGAPGDIPVPGQWDADPLDDVAVFRPSTGRWYIAGSPTSVSWGGVGDHPVAAPVRRPAW